MSTPTSTSEEERQLLPMEQMVEQIRKESREAEIEQLKAFRTSEEGRELLKWLGKEYQRCKSQREPFERQWALNLAVYNRKEKNALGLNTSGTKRAGHKNIHVNRVRSVVRTEMAKLNSQPPMVEVVPSTNELEDIAAAEGANALVQSQMDRKNYRSANTSAIFWQSVTGNGFVKTYWNPDAIDPSQVTSPLLMGTEGIVGGELTPGDMIPEAISPFHILVPDLRQEDIENQPYIIHLNMLERSVAETRWAAELAGEKIVPSVINTDNDIVDSATLNLTSSESESQRIPSVEVWIKRGAHKMFPQGGMLTVVGGVIVNVERTFPYVSGEYPISHRYGIPTGIFYRASTVEDILELQTEYNENASLMRNARNIMGKPQYIAAKGSIVAAKMNNLIGTVIEHKPGLPPPTIAPMADFPSYIQNEPERILRDIEDLSGQHQVSKGNIPTGVTAATALSYLGERDDAYIFTYYNSLETAVAKDAQTLLHLAIQFWDTERIVKTVGENQIFNVMQLSGIDLRNQTDVRVQAGSTIPMSKAARSAQLMDMYANGIIDKDQYLELNSMSFIGEVTDVVQVDRRQAQRENARFKTLDVGQLQMAQQQWEMQMQQLQAQYPSEMIEQMRMADPTVFAGPLAIPANEWDNHDIHIQYHNIFRKSQEFERLEPEVQEQIDLHVQAHTHLKQQKVLQEMFSQIPSDGSVAGLMGTMGANGMTDYENVTPENAMVAGETATVEGATGEEQAPPM